MPRTIRSRQALAFQPPPSPLIGLRVLVVEDEGLIGLMVEKFLERFGCQIVGIAGSAVDALQIIRTAAIDVAVVDVKLENGTAYALADALIAADRPLSLQRVSRPMRSTNGIHMSRWSESLSMRANCAEPYSRRLMVEGNGRHSEWPACAPSLPAD